MSASIQIVFSSTALGSTTRTYNLSDAQAQNIIQTVEGIINAGRQSAANINIAQSGGTYTPATTGDAINYIANVAFQAVRAVVVNNNTQAAQQSATAGVDPLNINAT